MKNFGFSILLISFLATFTELHEIFKIGTFIEHYWEHKQLNEDLDFNDFIVLHYSTNHHQDESSNKLPFKNHQDFNFVFKLFKINIPQNNASETIIFKCIIKTFVILNENKNSTKFIQNIWQPPKF